MAVDPTESFTVTRSSPADAAALAARMGQLAAAASGWVNLLPEVEPGHEPPPRLTVVAIFSSRGEPVPLATWTAPSTPGGRASVGVQHGSGPQALQRLADAGLALPAGWLKVADHPRRGLVVTTAPGAAAAEVAQWLLDAATALSTVPLTGTWLAEVFVPQ